MAESVFVPSVDQSPAELLAALTFVRPSAVSTVLGTNGESTMMVKAQRFDSTDQGANPLFDGGNPPPPVAFAVHVIACTPPVYDVFGRLLLGATCQGDRHAEFQRMFPGFVPSPTPGVAPRPCPLPSFGSCDDDIICRTARGDYERARVDHSSLCDRIRSLENRIEQLNLIALGYLSLVVGLTVFVGAAIVAASSGNIFAAVLVVVALAMALFFSIEATRISADVNRLRSELEELRRQGLFAWNQFERHRDSVRRNCNCPQCPLPANYLTDPFGCVGVY